MIENKPLDRLKPNGLSSPKWRYVHKLDSDSYDQARIFFPAPRKNRTVNYLSKQIARIACQDCPLANNCTGPNPGYMNQIHATVSVGQELSVGEWEIQLKEASCRPETPEWVK